MPCFDIDGNPVACSLENIRDGKVSVGFGADYDVALAQFKSASSGSDRYYPPDLVYDAQGQAYRWTMLNGMDIPVREPTFDDPTKAAGYQRPSTAPTPTTYPDKNGDIVGVDARSGREVYRIPGATFAQISPQEQERIRQGDLAAAQRYNTAERIAGETFTTNRDTANNVFTAGENQAGRVFTAGENALSRALDAGQFAATLQQQNQQNAFAADQAYQQGMERTNAARLGAAQQVANNISNVDPGALPAFYAAGGGNIANALASGASAQSDLANLGSARSLQTAENIQNPQRFAFNPVSFDASMYGQPQQMQQPQAVPQAQVPQVQAPAQQAIVPGSPQYDAYVKGVTGTSPWQSQNPAPGMAGGGMTSGMAVVGEEGPELAMAIPGGFAVMNEEQLGMDPMRLRTPRAADGGVFGFDINQVVQQSDQPYLDRISAIRSGVDTSNPLGIGPYNTKYRNLAPSLQNRQAASYQTAFGVPTQDFFAQEQQYRVPGASRGSFSLGY